MTIKVRAAALMFAGLLLVSCGKKEPAKEVTSPAAGRGNAGSLVTEGQALLENGDAEGAAELFRDAMRKDPKNVEARIGAARVQIRRKAYDVASESLDMAAKIEPENREVYEAFLELAEAADSTSYASKAVSLAEWNGQDWFIEKYVPENAAPDLAPGQFGDDTWVSLSGGEGEIHYSLKQNNKTRAGIYTTPLRLLRGKNTLQVWTERDKVPCSTSSYVYECDYPETERKFEDKTIEAMVRAELGKADGEKITNYECEEVETLSWYDIPYNNGSREQYQVKTFRDMRFLPSCTRLYLYDQKELPALSELKQSSVTDLDIINCGLRDLSFAADLSQLQLLRVSSNEITDASGLKYLPELDSLSIEGNPVRDLDEYLRGKNLRYLSVGGDQIKDFSLLADMEDFYYLSVTEAKDRDFSVLSSLKGLENLRLESCGISDLSFLKGMGSIEYLYLDSNQISDLSVLAELKKLESLELDDNQVTDLGPLSGLTELRNLYLSGNAGLSDITPLKGLKNLKYLYLRGTGVTEESAKELEKLLPECSVHLN